ncbi:MAG: Hpt domain-containing protein, partial [Bdellovibrionales bacterium]|nr:Hpt domain-containing protein [Bdellovibrionales bacterium]
EHFQMWLQAVFSQTLPFESLVELAPSTYEHSQGRAIHLEYYLLDPNEKAVAQIVMVATDRTLEKEAAKALEDEKQHAKMILKAFKYREQFSRFLNSLEGGISALLVQAGKRIGFDADEAFRNLHTMEGEAGAFSAHEIREACRECQDFLEPLRILDQGEDPNSLMNSYQQSVKRLAARFDQFLKDSEDIFTMLAVSGEAKIDIDRGDFCILLQELRDLGLDPKILEKYSDRYLKQSVQDMLIHYNDIVQLIAEKQGKIVAPIEFTGEDVRIYGDRYQFLFDSLVHVFRNSVDHGIEDIEIRLKEGKPETGRIVINTKLESVRGQNWIEITIADDGMGISADLLREKAKNSMPIESQVDWKDDDAVLQWIFHPGMTTRSFAGEFSGRGVGMDAVKKEVVRLGGDIRVESQLRKGTRFIMRIPEIGEALELKAIA